MTDERDNSPGYAPVVSIGDEAHDPVALRLRSEVPSPRPAFRASLRAGIMTAEAASPGSDRRLPLIYAVLGLAALGLAALGVAGVGPLAA